MYGEFQQTWLKCFGKWFLNTLLVLHNDIHLSKTTNTTDKKTLQDVSKHIIEQCYIIYFNGIMFFEQKELHTMEIQPHRAQNWM